MTEEEKDEICNKQILDIPLQTWIESIIHRIKEAKNAFEVANACYEGMQLCLKKDKLEKARGSLPLDEKLVIS